MEFLFNFSLGVIIVLKREPYLLEINTEMLYINKYVHMIFKYCFKIILGVLGLSVWVKHNWPEVPKFFKLIMVTKWLSYSCLIMYMFEIVHNMFR